MTDNIYYNLATLGCFVAFCLMVHFYRSYVPGLFGIFRGRATVERLMDDRGKIFAVFLAWSLVLWIVITGLTALKFADILSDGGVSQLDDNGQIAAIVGVVGAVAAVWGFRYVLLKIAGGLTMSGEFVARLFFLRKIVVAIGTVVLLPVFLLFALSEGAGARTLGVIVVVIVAAVALLLAVRTLMLFVRHRFSISLWFLYLCAVEIFPVSLIVVAAGICFGNH